MQRKLIALAAVAFCELASAQSSVTLSGAVDLGYTSVKTNQGRLSGLESSGYRSSRLAFTGVEDLGGGLSTTFWLEGGFNPNSGAGVFGTSANNQNGGLGSGAFIFNRRATVSIVSATHS